MSNPYASPLHPVNPSAPGGGGGGGAVVMAPLHDATFFIRFVAWFNIVVGALYALTIVGIVFAWVPIWIGLCLNNAAEGLKQGQRTGSDHEYLRATRNLSTVFKIIGVLLMVYLVLMAMYLAVVFVMLVVGLGTAAANA